MAATAGAVGSAGSGRLALAHSARTLPGVSWPSSVVRSIIEIAVSSAHRLAVVLIDRLASMAARASAPTSSTPGSPCRNPRSEVPERTCVSAGALIGDSFGPLITIVTHGHGSQLRAVPRGQDDLGDEVTAQTELLRYFLGPQALLVVEESQFLLLPAPRTAHGLRRGGAAFGRPTALTIACPVACPYGDGGRRGGRHRGAERTAPLIVILSAGQVVPGVLVEDQVLLRGLVHPDGHHGQALEILLLAVGCHAVVVLFGPLGMQLTPARYALRH